MKRGGRYEQSKEQLDDALLIGGAFNELRWFMNRNPEGVEFEDLIQFMEGLDYDSRFIIELVDALVRHKGYYRYDRNLVIPVAVFAEEINVGNEVVIVRAGDFWAAVYVNGELFWEGEYDEAVEQAWIELGREDIEASSRYADDMEFPRSLADVERI